jgi:hypothetical protein
MGYGLVNKLDSLDPVSHKNLMMTEMLPETLVIFNQRHVTVQGSVGIHITYKYSTCSVHYLLALPTYWVNSTNYEAPHECAPHPQSWYVSFLTVTNQVSIHTKQGKITVLYFNLYIFKTEYEIKNYSEWKQVFSKCYPLWISKWTSFQFNLHHPRITQLPA